MMQYLSGQAEAAPAEIIWGTAIAVALRAYDRRRDSSPAARHAGVRDQAVLSPPLAALPERPPSRPQPRFIPNGYVPPRQPWWPATCELPPRRGTWRETQRMSYPEPELQGTWRETQRSYREPELREWVATDSVWPSVSAAVA